MDAEELKKRTKRFALAGMDLAGFLPKTIKGRIVEHQFLRCATSVGANYRAATRPVSC
jgi:four helix bundle protein